MEAGSSGPSTLIGMLLLRNNSSLLELGLHGRFLLASPQKVLLHGQVVLFVRLHVHHMLNKTVRDETNSRSCCV